MAAGILDDFSHKYAPMASISWRVDGKRGLHIMDSSPRRFILPEEAAMFALTEARQWIENSEAGCRPPENDGASVNSFFREKFFWPQSLRTITMGYGSTST